MPTTGGPLTFHGLLAVIPYPVLYTTEYIPYQYLTSKASRWSLLLYHHPHVTTLREQVKKFVRFLLDILQDRHGSAKSRSFCSRQESTGIENEVLNGSRSRLQQREWRTAAVTCIATRSLVVRIVIERQVRCRSIRGFWLMRLGSSGHPTP